MKTYRALAALATAVVVCAVAPVRASSVLSGPTSILKAPGTLVGTPAGSGTNGAVTLLSNVGFVKGSQVFSDAITIPAAGTLTVQLAGISWLDALQNLNCFVSAPGGGIIGNAKNGDLDSVQVQPGTVYVNWYAQAEAPLYLGAYAISVNFQPTAPPPPTVPLPPALPLLVSGLGALTLGLRRTRLSAATTGA